MQQRLLCGYSGSVDHAVAFEQIARSRRAHHVWMSPASEFGQDWFGIVTCNFTIDLIIN
jgi:hypothetical protein